MTMMTTKDVATRMGLNITADFIENVIDVPATDSAGKAKLWDEAAYARIAERTSEFILNTIEEPAPEREKKGRRSRHAHPEPVKKPTKAPARPVPTTDEEEL